MEMSRGHVFILSHMQLPMYTFMYIKMICGLARSCVIMFTNNESIYLEDLSTDREVEELHLCTWKSNVQMFQIKMLKNWMHFLLSLKYWFAMLELKIRLFFGTNRH